MREDNPGDTISVKSGKKTRRDFLSIGLAAGAAVLMSSCAAPTSPTAVPTTAPAAKATTAPVAPTSAPAAKATTAPVAPTTAPAAPATQATAAPASAAKPTGTLTVAIPNVGNPTYTPARINNDAMLVAVATFGECLLGRKADNSLTPMLAEKYSVSPDGKTLTFDLQKGIKFHDGSDLTSADVKFTFDQATRKDSTNADAGLWRDAIESIETPTPQQVVFHLKERNIGLLPRLAVPKIQAQVILSKTYIEKVGEDTAAQKPVGTGPWKMAEFKPGELARFEAVESHWRQTPAFKELVVRQVPEESTRVSMVLRGEADLVQVNVSQMKRLQDGGANLVLDKTAYVLMISLQGQDLPSRPNFNPKKPWVADPADKQAWERARKVREAMNIAIDRKAIVDKILVGQGEPANTIYNAPGTPFYDPSWKPISYDPARAKQLLAEAGYPQGFEFTLYMVDNPQTPGALPAGEAAAQYWQAIGLRPKMQPADYTATIRPALTDRNLSGSAFTWTNQPPDEPVIGHAGGFASFAERSFGAEYPPLDDLITKALATDDYEQRRQLQLQMAKMIQDEFFVVPLAWAAGLWGTSKRVKSWPRIQGLSNPYNFEYATPAG